MAIDRGPWNALVDDDGSNLVGTVWNKDKIKTVILDPTDAAIAAVPTGPTPPVWTDIPYAAGNFSALGGTWAPTAGQQLTFAWRRDGNLLIVLLYMAGATVTGAPTVLYVTVPLAVTWRNYAVGFVNIGGTIAHTALYQTTPGLNRVDIFRDLSQQPFTAGTVSVACTMTLPLA